MINRHVYDLLDSKPFAKLSVEELRQIENHVKECRKCFDSYQSAKLLQSLWNEKRKEVIEPSPFFHTRVMTSVRQRHKKDSETLLSRCWRAAAPLIFAMMVFVIMLTGISLILPTPTENASSSSNFVSTEMVIMNEKFSNEITNEEAFQMLYVVEVHSKR